MSASFLENVTCIAHENSCSCLWTKACQEWLFVTRLQSNIFLLFSWSPLLLCKSKHIAAPHVNNMLIYGKFVVSINTREIQQLLAAIS